eukprot:Plantae.Rhodophyta-Purpureofilum_apyrenoidigerum.ctg20354.p1 GENE.Plantae.Rhodophyta-Purpureofilum_apyrenoidigerum.ctg20354~~Plantae.Rhodophyta-Purpureofilum_apyrenoidigerum.ctg20354.p1  ORF type:complete len:219 (+),score=68.56 Plantae.Rhodophyta-Purpureofilum_apyrenoidigerum.ctg20354:330-986(+)
MGIFSRKKEMEPPAPPPPPPPTAKDMARQYKREIDRAIREIDRERTKMEQQEKQIQINIKKAAKDGEMTSAKMLAKELVRNRETRSKMHKMKTQMQTASSQLTTMTTTQTMANVMGGVVRAMSVMNRQMDLPAMQKVVMDYEKQSNQMEMTQEMMDDAMDSITGQDTEESEDIIISKVLDELGLEQEAAMGVVPSGGPASVHVGANDDLISRLDNVTK